MITVIIKQNIIIINVETKQTIPKAGAVIKNTIVNIKQKMPILFVKDKTAIIKNTRINPIKYIIQTITYTKKAQKDITITIIIKQIIKAETTTQNPMPIVEHIQTAFRGNTQVKQTLKQKQRMKINRAGTIINGEQIKLIVKQINIKKQALQTIRQVELINIGAERINIIIKIIINIPLTIRIM